MLRVFIPVLGDSTLLSSFLFDSLLMGAPLRCSWSPQKSTPFALWVDLSPRLCISESPQYMKYSGLPESLAETKSLPQISKKELSCGCPTGTIKGRHIFLKRRAGNQNRPPEHLRWFPIFSCWLKFSLPHRCHSPELEKWRWVMLYYL